MSTPEISPVISKSVNVAFLGTKIGTSIDMNFSSVNGTIDLNPGSFFTENDSGKKKIIIYISKLDQLSS